MNMQQFTHLGRPIDLTYPTNKAIAVISTSTLIIVVAWGLLAQSLFLKDALLQAAGFAGAVFMTWALARETDPDGEFLAFYCIPPTVLLVYLLGRPAFDLLLLTLLLMRLVNRTVGLVATPGDALLVLVLTAWIAHDGAWYIVLCTATAFALDSFLVQPNPSHKWVAMLVAVAAIVLFLTKGELYIPKYSGSLLWLAFAGVLGTIAMLLFTPEIRSKSDLNGPIYLQRLQASCLLALLLALFTFCLGSQGFVALAPFWSVLIVIGIDRLVLWTMNL